MNAEVIANGLDGRKTSKGYRARCPAHHPDRNPSLDITEAAGKTLVICRAGCRQSEVIAALRDRGLWNAASPSTRPAFRWADHLRTEPLIVTDCCLDSSSTCEHWRAFNRRFLLPQLRKNLEDAANEVAEKLRRCDQPVTADNVREGIEFAISFGAIVPAGVDGAIVEKAVVKVVEGMAWKKAI